MNISYVSINEPVYNEITKNIRKTYPNACIIEISKIHHHEDTELFFLQRFENYLQENENTEIIQLYHGTSEESVKNILDCGFKKSLNTISAYGKGTYFSNNVSVSRQYASIKASRRQREEHGLIFTIIADVIISNKGLAGTKPEPSCYVNSITQPSIFCVPHDENIIPRYMVSYVENAV